MKTLIVLDTEYLDATISWKSRALRWPEGRLRVNVRQTLQVAHIVRAENYETVLSLSESVAISPAYLLPRSVRHVVQVHHLLSPRKLRVAEKSRAHVIRRAPGAATAMMQGDWGRADGTGYRHIGIMHNSQGTALCCPRAG